MLPFLFSPPFRKVNEDDQLYLTYLQHKAAFHTGTSQRPLLGFLLWFVQFCRQKKNYVVRLFRWCTVHRGGGLRGVIDAHREAWLRGLMHSDSAMGSIPRSFLKIEYLGKIVTKFENTLICLSGAQWFESWKYSGKKSPNTPLKSFNTLRKSNKMSYPVYFVIFVN